MKTYALVRNGDAATAFEVREQAIPSPKKGEIVIKTEAFGLNYADVMARLGLYQDAPPLPAVLGYEVVGRIHALGEDVSGFQLGDRVVAMTRFGGYADYAMTQASACAAIPDTMQAGVAAALATQYITAYHAACEQTNLQQGEHVLIHAAAGGVGIALVQIAKQKGCIVYGTCGSDEKIAFLKTLGVDFPINYTKEDWTAVVKNLRGKEGLDVIFDSLGGSSVSKGFKALGAGGRFIGYGAANMAGESKNMLRVLKTVIGFGLYSPIQFLGSSKAFIGINMLRIADSRPEIIKRCLDTVIKLAKDGHIAPYIGGEFPASDLAKAHDFLGRRSSIGKVICTI
ncbi:MAG: hypothetical protein RI894_2087 [Bacteroidota bacterium]|jgi:NADPH2:quinone reductase